MRQESADIFVVEAAAVAQQMELHLRARILLQVEKNRADDVAALGRVHERQPLRIDREREELEAVEALERPAHEILALLAEVSRDLSLMQIGGLREASHGQKVRVIEPYEILLTEQRRRGSFAL